MDFIKADVLTRLCGSFEDEQEGAHSAWQQHCERDQLKHRQRVVVTVLDHDTALTRQTDDFIYLHHFLLTLFRC